MKKNLKNLIALLTLLIILGFARGAETPNAQQILKKVDEILTSPKDISALMKVTIIERNGQKKIREIKMYQKGNEKRLVKVLAPADHKGIGFLSLPNDILYVYLPAYKKTRRIAAHVKNQKFIGSDFTYEDLEAKNYSLKYKPEFLSMENDCYILKLTPLPDVVSEYSKVILYVRIEDNFPIRAEYYKKDELVKIMGIPKVEKIKGYLIATEYSMQDLRSGNKTEMAISEIELDKGISDEIFTERNLAR